MCSALNRKQSGHSSLRGSSYELCYAPQEYVTTVLVPEGGRVYDPSRDDQRMEAAGIRVVAVPSVDPRGRGGKGGEGGKGEGEEGAGQPRFDDKALVDVIAEVVAEARVQGRA